MHGMHLWAIQVKRAHCKFVQLRPMGLLRLMWLMTLWLMGY